MSLWLAFPLLAAAAAAVVLLAAQAIAAPGVTPEASRRASPPEPTPAPPRPVARPGSALRLVMVAVMDGGVVVDAIVDRGAALGSPGTPVTLVLKTSDPCDTSSMIKDLQDWAQLDTVVDLTLVADHGAPAAAFSDGEVAVRLPILGLRS
ncbi:MAG TPA: hypothetical protein VF230_01015 [Acidimicrobiales bacterium]